MIKITILHFHLYKFIMKMFMIYSILYQ